MGTARLHNELQVKFQTAS